MWPSSPASEARSPRADTQAASLGVAFLAPGWCWWRRQPPSSTRNMLTGASSARVVPILGDAKRGLLQETRRHHVLRQRGVLEWV